MKLIDKIKNLPIGSVILISGFAGSGKSTLARKIGNYIDAQIVSVDDFYQEQSEYHNWENYDYEGLISNVIDPFKSKKHSTYKAFNWSNPSKTLYKNLKYSKYLILEGVGLFRESILKHADISIWINCSLEKAHKMGKTRDKEEYQVDNSALWDTIWRQNDMESYQTLTPEERADIVVQCFRDIK